MTNFTAVFNRVSDKLGIDANQIIPHFGNLWNLYNSGKLFLTTEDEEHGVTVYYIRHSTLYAGQWTIEATVNPCKRFSPILHKTDEEMLETVLDLMYKGATLEEHSLLKWAHYIRQQRANWLVYEHNVIVLSDGKETVSFYYDKDTNHFITGGGLIRYEDSAKALANIMADGFKVVFTDEKQQEEN